jgi:hypothetical protein
LVRFADVAHHDAVVAAGGADFLERLRIVAGRTHTSGACRASPTPPSWSSRAPSRATWRGRITNAWLP